MPAKVTRWQNLIPSFPWIMQGWRAQSKESKGSNFAAQHSGAIVQKPKGPNTYDLKIWLSPSGNHDGGASRRGGNVGEQGRKEQNLLYAAPVEEARKDGTRKERGKGRP